MKHERLTTLLEYNAETGEFRWRVSQCPRIPAGSLAGCLEADGYVRIQIDGKRYPAGPLAWFYTHRVWPAQVIDHKNRDRADNRLANLRCVTQGENLKNTGVSRRNKSGYKGVRWVPERSKWRATIMVDGKTISLGYFLQLEEAVAARLAAEEAYGFHRQPQND